MEGKIPVNVWNLIYHPFHSSQLLFNSLTSLYFAAPTVFFSSIFPIYFSRRILPDFPFISSLAFLPFSSRVIKQTNTLFPSSSSQRLPCHFHRLSSNKQVLYFLLILPWLPRKFYRWSSSRQVHNEN